MRCPLVPDAAEIDISACTTCSKYQWAENSLRRRAQRVNKPIDCPNDQQDFDTYQRHGIALVVAGGHIRRQIQKVDADHGPLRPPQRAENATIDEENEGKK